MTAAPARISEAVDQARFPNLASFVEWGIDMQMADIRDLLRLPLDEAGMVSGQNFTASGALANVVAGSSVWFFEASEAGLRDRRDRSRRYDDVLRGYWPWDGEVVSVDDGVRVLYDYVRNPLSHSFGLPDPEDGIVIAIEKAPLGDGELTELDGTSDRPTWLGPTVRLAPSGAPDRAYVISVPAMYWGVRQLLRALLTDETQAAAAEALAGVLVRFLTAPNASWRASASTRS